MSEAKAPEVLLIFNPVAGRKGAGREAENAARLFSQHGYTVRMHATSGPGDAAEFTRRYAAGCRLVVCCGGDGTFHEVVNGLLRSGSSAAIGCLPAGTTNDMAETLQMPRKVGQAAEAVLYGQAKRQDAGTFGEGRFFAYVASFGAFTGVAYATPQRLKNVLGYLAYFSQILPHMHEMKGYPLSLQADGWQTDGDFLFGSISNTRTISGLFRFKSSDVQTDDGAFELMLLRRPRNPLAFFRIAFYLITRRTDGDLVIFRHVRSVSFRFHKETAWTLDGEYAGTFRHAKIGVLPHALRLVYPPAKKALTCSMNPLKGSRRFPTRLDWFQK